MKCEFLIAGFELFGPFYNAPFKGFIQRENFIPRLFTQQCYSDYFADTFKKLYGDWCKTIFFPGIELQQCNDLCIVANGDKCIGLLFENLPGTHCLRTQR